MNTNTNTKEDLIVNPTPSKELDLVTVFVKKHIESGTALTGNGPWIDQTENKLWTVHEVYMNFLSMFPKLNEYQESIYGSEKRFTLKLMNHELLLIKRTKEKKMHTLTNKETGAKVLKEVFLFPSIEEVKRRLSNEKRTEIEIQYNERTGIFIAYNSETQNSSSGKNEGLAIARVKNLDRHGNINCKNCVNCKECINCIDCTNCIKCSNVKRSHSCYEVSNRTGESDKVIFSEELSEQLMEFSMLNVSKRIITAFDEKTGLYTSKSLSTNNSISSTDKELSITRTNELDTNGNTNCFNCVDCYNCHDCEYCYNCVSCKLCIKCTDCRSSMRLDHCGGCKDCIDCDWSAYCIDCAGCSECIKCYNLADSKNRNPQTVVNINYESFDGYVDPIIFKRLLEQHS